MTARPFCSSLFIQTERRRVASPAFFTSILKRFRFFSEISIISRRPLLLFSTEMYVIPASGLLGFLNHRRLTLLGETGVCGSDLIVIERNEIESSPTSGLSRCDKPLTEYRKGAHEPK